MRLKGNLEENSQILRSQHAIKSIRKVRTYIANILDDKFVPHDSHGINHVKHNLEYGFQLMGLIECKRRSLRH